MGCPSNALAPRGIFLTLRALLLGIWVLDALALVSFSPVAASPHLVILKGAVAAFGIVSAWLALGGRVRWQPWVLAAALAFLILHGTLTSLMWFRDGIDAATVRSLLVTRFQAVRFLFVRTGFLTSGGYFVEQIAMPVIQLIAAAIAVARWRAAPPSVRAASGGPG